MVKIKAAILKLKGFQKFFERTALDPGESFPEHGRPGQDELFQAGHYAPAAGDRCAHASEDPDGYVLGSCFFEPARETMDAGAHGGYISATLDRGQLSYVIYMLLLFFLLPTAETLFSPALFCFFLKKGFMNKIHGLNLNFTSCLQHDG